jgi:hypothetical protein
LKKRNQIKYGSGKKPSVLVVTVTTVILCINIINGKDIYCRCNCYQ